MKSIQATLAFFLAASVAMSAGPGWAQETEELPEDYERTGFIVGVNGGLGFGQSDFGISGHPNIAQDREPGLAINLRLGWVWQEWLVLGFEGSGWLKNYELLDADTLEQLPSDVSYSLLGGFVHGYIFEGIFGRVALGTGTTSIHQRGNPNTFSESGFGYALGIGYEHRSGRTLALTPIVEYVTYTVDPVEVDDGEGGVASVDLSADYINVTLGLSWFF